MNLVFRVDANTWMGTGHMMRCLSLAQVWQDASGQAIFATTVKIPLLDARLRLEKIQIVTLSAQMGSAEDAKETATLAKNIGANWIVVDGYHFGTKYQQIIKNFGLSLLFIDDYGQANHYYADIVLNQNVYAYEGLYANREPYTQLLLGTRYVLLRREFHQWQGWTRQISEVARKVLVTLGGSDLDNVTLKVIQGLQQVDIQELEAVVVVGASNPHYKQLQTTIKASQFPFSLERNVKNMPELMGWADVAISAGGSTTWELAFMGLPSLILVLADNQRAIAEKLGEMGVAVNLGWHTNVSVAEIAQAMKQLLVSSGIRAEMSRQGQELIDGEGTARVLMHLQDQPLRLRPVRQEDCKLLWKWANDPEVRAASFSSDPIPWEQHLQWFVNKLHDSNCYIFIVFDYEDRAIGQVRFERQDGNEAEISISLDKGQRGSGYGSRFIDIAVKELFRHTSISSVYALIKPNNGISIRAFEKAHFKKLGNKTVRGNIALHYVLFK